MKNWADTSDKSYQTPPIVLTQIRQ